MRIEEFLSRLEKVADQGGGNWMACCPAHEDKNPSMSVSERDGKILVHCHAGCTAQAIVDAMGLKLSDLFAEPLATPADRGARRTAPAKSEAVPPPAPPTVDAPAEKKKKSGDHGKWVCDYIYQDAGGKTLYKIERRVKADGKKIFCALRPDPQSSFGWTWGLGDLPRVPFRLPRIVARAKAGGTIVICEGEKDVLNIEKLGLCATCNALGAGEWGHNFPAGWGEWFKGLKGICIIADKDKATIKRKKRGKEVEEPFLVGQRHAWSVKEQLRAAGVECPIKLMVMPDVEKADGEVLPVKDFTDWSEARVAAGLTAGREDFKRVVAEAAEWPDEWCFEGEAAAAENVARAKKSARDAISTTPQDGGAAGGAGRFGRPVPRTPTKEARQYEVDFDLGGGKLVTMRFDYGWSVERIFAYAIVAVANNCPNRDIPRGVPQRVKYFAAAWWLLMRGSFFWHADYRDFRTCMFLDRDPRECRLMNIMSDEFFAFVGREAKLEQVDPKSGDLAKILGLVNQIAVSEEYSQGVHPSHSWDRRGNAIYVSSGDAEMCRIKDGTVEMVQNGTDGVVFLRGKTLAPWKLVDDGKDPFVSAKLFAGASFADAYGLMNVRLWVLNLFACHATKPPLLITGGAGSGKTRMAKGIKEILGIRQDGAADLSIQKLTPGEKGEQAFWVTINDGRLEVFDNFDTKVSWASDALQVAATDGQVKGRRLWTDAGVSILRANASLILTSNNPIFSTEGNGGLSDRLITIPLTLNRAMSLDTELSREIAAERNRYMSWMVRTVARAICDEAPVDASINRRHPDYGIFSVRIGRAIGDEAGAVAALGAAEADKALLPLLNDSVTREVVEVLRANSWHWRGTAGEMSQAIIDRQGDRADEKTSSIFSSRRVGKALNKYLRQFSVIFQFPAPRTLAGKTLYEITGLTALGESVVGLVDLRGEMPHALGETPAQTDTPPARNNPPNPPNGGELSRARDISLFDSREKNEEEEEGVEYDDIEF